MEERTGLDWVIGMLVGAGYYLAFDLSLWLMLLALAVCTLLASFIGNFARNGMAMTQEDVANNAVFMASVGAVSCIVYTVILAVAGLLL